MREITVGKIEKHYNDSGEHITSHIVLRVPHFVNADRMPRFNAAVDRMMNRQDFGISWNVYDREINATITDKNAEDYVPILKEEFRKLVQRWNLRVVTEVSSALCA
jgi:hypothetical protein